MAWQNMPKMSLVAQYDDLCRYTNILTNGCEGEFKTFVENQRELFRRLADKDSEVKNLKERVLKMDSERKIYETKIAHLRALLAEEMAKRTEVEKEKKSMENQIAIIKEVLLADCNMDNQTKEKLAFLSTASKPNSPPRLTTIEESVGSLLSFSDDDPTGNTLEFDDRKSSSRKRRSRGKRSGTENKTSPKRPKSDKVESETDIDSDIPEVNNFRFKVIEVRSNSEPATNTPDVPITRPTHRSDSEQFQFNTDLRRSNTGPLSLGTPVGRYSTGGKLSRTHNFVSKTVLRIEKCVPCGGQIKFCKQVLKCQDCRVICHTDCKDKCPLPCIPSINTPTKGTVGTIADYTSSTPPMIPALIVHCVNEIESRGLREIGLYRVPGSDREVKDLKEKLLRGRSIPCLNQIDIHAICGTIKEFLRSLKEPLVPRSAWKTMVEVADVSDEKLSLNALYESVMDFPQSNRDTLAFLMLHLQRIADSQYCKMPIENLAKIFGPTIVGYSTPDSNVLNEVVSHNQVMHRLLSIPTDSWQNLLNVETDVFHTPMQKTPEVTPAPKVTRLGPIHTSAQKPRSMTLSRTPLTPRNHKSSNKSGKIQFSSPFLKY